VQADAVQTPALQVEPLVQTTAQPPQLLGSLLVLISQPSVALRLQSAKPGLQDSKQLPCAQVGVALLLEQATLQAPQLLGSVCSFTHVVPHNVCPGGHGARFMQELARQKETPGWQTKPQAPQLLLSLCVFVQAPLQSTWPPVQPVGQAPLVQAWPLGQAVPQEPQFEGSALVVVQNPLQEVPEQASVSPWACILYSTSRLASAPVFEAQVEPVRREAWSTSPALNVMTMAPVSDQFWPGVRTRS
jgi:hypothetical protein